MTLEERVTQLEQDRDILLTVLWTLRGDLGGTGKAMTNKLSPLWNRYLEEQNKPLANQTVTGISAYDTE